MKLTTDMVERTLSQFEARVIPETHPVVPQLSKLFGDHTFFLDGKGLNIVEPADSVPGKSQPGKVVSLARWENDERAALAPHDPQDTEVVVELAAA
jgi:hypothetical protein